MRFLILLFICLITTSKTIAQDIVKMEKSSGVYFIPCKVNGLPLKFIFDTGASDVSISLTEALFMLKNGYLKESDIRGTVYYSIANGEIAEGTRINIQKIEVGKQILYNVEASIVHSTEAPLLFGQSAMERFGKFTMDYSNSNLIINGTSNSVSNSTNSSSIKSVKIGNQTWMTENLNVDRFRNGDLIPEAKTDEEWKKAGENKQPAWCYYNNDPKNGLKYGKLYNYYVISDSRGISPLGCHIPSENEWRELIFFLDQKSNNTDNGPMSWISGKNLKSTSGWQPYNSFDKNGDNKSKFSAKPAGARNYLHKFEYLGSGTYFWSTSESDVKNPQICDYPNDHCIYVFYLNHSNSVYRSWESKNRGFSIRCIKD